MKGQMASFVPIRVLKIRPAHYLVLGAGCFLWGLLILESGIGLLLPSSGYVLVLLGSLTSHIPTVEETQPMTIISKRTKGRLVQGRSRKEAGDKICALRVDFRIHHNDGSYELAEVKGFETDVYKLKRKLLEFIWLPEHPDHSYTVIASRGIPTVQERFPYRSNFSSRFLRISLRSFISLSCFAICSSSFCRDDIRCRGSKTHSWQAGTQSEGGVWSRSSSAPPRRWIFARLICPSYWVPPQLYRSTGER